jgi:hypothetical protein
MRVSLEETVTAVLRDLSVPVFFAGIDASKKRLTLHAPAGCDVGAISAQVESALEKAGTPLQVSVHAHRLGQLAFPRSIEQWLARFSGGNVVLHDPTLVVSHARRLVAAGAACRAALGKVVTGTFFDPIRRTFLVLTRKGHESAALQPQVAVIVARAYDSGAVSAKTPSSLNVQVVQELPRRDVVPIDAKSASRLRRAARIIRRWLAPTAVLLAMSSVPAAASREPVQVGSPPALSTSLDAVGSQAHKAEFGVLSGLSVFTEGQAHDTFASMTLEWFFGNAAQTAGAGVQLAQNQTCRPEDVKAGTCDIFYTGS